MLHYDVTQILNGVWFWAALWAWMLAQTTKMLCALARSRKLDLGYFVSTGGMPSAHSALVSGLAAALGFTEGFGSALFAMGMAFALLTMFDASTVRRAAGMQARLLNEMINELFKEHRFSEHKLAELLGHTRLEVFMGMLMGVLVAMLVVSRSG